MDEKFGYINPRGEFSIKAKFRSAKDFDQGLAKVVLGGREEKVPLTENEKAIFKKRGSSASTTTRVVGAKSGYIDKSGYFVWQKTH